MINVALPSPPTHTAIKSQKLTFDLLTNVLLGSLFVWFCPLRVLNDSCWFSILSFFFEKLCYLKGKKFLANLLKLSKCNVTINYIILVLEICSLQYKTSPMKNFLFSRRLKKTSPEDIRSDP